MIEDVLKKPSEQAWVPVNSITKDTFKNQYDQYLGYKIKQGDVIKFGRVRFRIKKISSNKEIKSKIDNLNPANSLHFTDNKDYIVDNENSQHSFGSSAIYEMK